MAIKTRSKRVSSGAKKKANDANQKKLATKGSNLEKGKNPETGREFFVIKENKIIASFQTRKGANEFKKNFHFENSFTTGLAVVEESNLVTFFTNRFFKGVKVTSLEWNKRYNKTIPFVQKKLTTI